MAFPVAIFGLEKQKIIVKIKKNEFEVVTVVNCDLSIFREPASCTRLVPLDLF